MRDFIRFICCLYLPADETTEAKRSDTQKGGDRIKPVSVPPVIPKVVSVPESILSRSTPAGGARYGSTATTGRLPSPDIAVPAGFLPRLSNSNQVDASTQTYFDDCLGQNCSPTSRHRTSIPTILRIGRQQYKAR